MLDKIDKSIVIDYMEEINRYNNTTYINECNYYKRNGYITRIPYDYYSNPDNKLFTFYFDNETELFYTYVDDMKIYVPGNNGDDLYESNYTLADNYYNDKITKVDDGIQSPHQYQYTGMKVEEGDIVVDCGASEGLFALSVADKAKHIYLIEGDEKYKKALELNFKDYLDKITIIPKFISDTNDNNNVTLDSILSIIPSDETIFVKADIEGYEIKMLNHCKEYLEDTNQKLKFAICTYHNQWDEYEIPKLLQDCGFKWMYSDGYILQYYSDTCNPPFLKHGLVRATKNI